MEIKAKLKNVYENIIYDCTEAVFEVPTKDLIKLVGQDVRLKVTKWHEKRSLDANAYFHVLCDKLRQAIGISMAHCKNDLITTYGQIDYLSEGVPIVYKTNAPPEFICEREEIHMKYIKSVDDTYFYKVYRGSHTYDTKEMAQLIDGAVMECKAHDIETLPPEQLMRLKQAWRAIDGGMETDNTRVRN